MTLVTPILALLLMATGIASALAGDGSPPQSEEARATPALFEYIRQNPACSNFTDSCVICRRHGDRLDCSTPAIACVTEAPACTDPALTDGAEKAKAQ